MPPPPTPPKVESKIQMMKRQNISSGAKWENIVGYSRAVRVGNIIEVAGTTASEGDKIIAAGNAYEQTKYIIQKIERALSEAGATLNDVVRTRMFVTDISKWEEIGKAHGEFFKEIKPAATMVEVNALIHPDLVVEMEVTAIAPSNSPKGGE
ncbi:MAG: putative aminoacrylate peracid reductase RutC [Bacteroidia bacterium]|nr:putative aminoacrylate peracid reductase RutC [Bacteroidia bacterium]